LETQRPGLETVLLRLLSARAAGHATLPQAEATTLQQNVRDRVKDLLDEWCRIAHGFAQHGGVLQYQHEVGGSARLLYEFLNPDAPPAWKFRANRSMRDVEPSVNLWLKTLDRQDVAE
jgi:hypothetical protein